MKIQDASPAQAAALGQLLVQVYAALPGFPSPAEQPGYYEMLARVGTLAERPRTQVRVALDAAGSVRGGLVYFGDMAQYGSGGSATQLQGCAGIRLLAVDPATRGQGIGKALTLDALALARAQGQQAMVLHTTQAMQTAWKMYEGLGFARAPELDFSQQGLAVFGFRLPL